MRTIGLLLVLLLGGCALPHEPDRLAPSTEAAPTPSRAAEALRAWDASRAKAWAAGDLPGLRSLYVPGSAGADADVRRLRRWRERGFVVRRMQRQVLVLRERRSTPTRLVLEVTDRLAGAVAVRGRRQVRLPGSRARSRLLVLQRTEAGWRMRSVRPASPRR